MSIDTVNLKKYIQILENQLKVYEDQYDREQKQLENGITILNVKDPSEFDQKIFESIVEQAVTTVTKKLHQPKRTGPHNKPSGQLEEHWDKLQQIYDQPGGRDMSAQQIANAMLKRHQVVISNYFINRFRIMVRAKQQSTAAQTKTIVD